MGSAMAKSRRREIWYERDFLWHAQPASPAGWLHFILWLGGSLGLGVGGMNLYQHRDGGLHLLGGLMFLVGIIWMLVNFVVAALHTGPKRPPWKN